MPSTVSGIGNILVNKTQLLINFGCKQFINSMTAIYELFSSFRLFSSLFSGILP